MFRKKTTLDKLNMANGRVLMEKTEHTHIYKVLKISKNVNYESLGKKIEVGDLVISAEYTKKMEDYKKELRDLANENIRLNTINAILTLENKQLKERLRIHSVVKSLPTKQEAEIELSTMLVEIERNTKESYLKRTILKGIEIGFKKGYNYTKGNCI